MMTYTVLLSIALPKHAPISSLFILIVSEFYWGNDVSTLNQIGGSMVVG